MAKWYITKYAKTTSGQYELLTFLDAQPYEIAKYKHSCMDSSWHLECRLGSLEQSMHYTLPKRECYSHIPYKATLQQLADKKAQELLSMFNRISSLPTLQKYLTELLEIKPLITKPQYDVLYSAYTNNPYVRRVQYDLYN